MKKSVGTFEAKTHFTKIISKVMAGEEVIISRRGKNVAKSMQLGKFNWNEWKSYKDEGRR